MTRITDSMIQNVIIATVTASKGGEHDNLSLRENVVLTLGRNVQTRRVAFIAAHLAAAGRIHCRTIAADYGFELARYSVAR
jgi:hypothetical protein